jgi:hypothetical protein
MHGFVAPEDRARLLGLIVEVAAPIAGPVSYGMLFEQVLMRSGFKEEEAGSEILRAVAELIIAGVFVCNHHKPASGEIYFRHETELRLGARMMSFIWKEELNEEGGAAA